jgi:LysR family transcriptional regulator, carnitine catabolism transcriptional activator
MPVHPNITLRQMRAFVEAYRLRNLTHAAEAMHITQSAMSALIRQFEEDLGTRLFERTPRSLRPTKAADHAYRKVSAILDEVLSLGQDMRDRSGEAGTVLSFSCAPLLFSYVVPAVLKEFLRLQPDAKTVLYDAIDASLIQKVLDEDVEFSIGFFDHEPEAVTRNALVEDYLCAVCSGDSPLASRERVTWEDLVNQPLINLSRGAQVQQLVTEALAGAGRTFRPAYEISFIHTALGLAAQGLGVVVIPGYLVRGTPYMSALVVRKIHDPTIERSLLYHTRQGHALSPTAMRFLDMLRQHLLSLD